MDSIETIRRVSSARLGSSSIWRDSGREAFSKSSRHTEDENDDEEALKWATLEKLPTYQRIRRGILRSEDDGKSIEIVDVESLGSMEKKNLLERLVRIAEQDNEAFLLKLKERIDRVGISLPTIEVRFENLSVGAEAYVGKRALPTILNFSANILEVSGRVTYNGHEMNEFVPQRTSAYISQHDLHIGEMTVRETLAFSARCQGVGYRYDMLTELSRREKEANIKPDPDLDVFLKAASLEGQKTSVVIDYVLKILGLDICADTFVGNEMRRGISGGQKKRVTTGEMLVGPSRALFMDEISTGLDSSTTFQIVNAIRQSVHILQGTIVISLLQPAPETYDLFDDIILLSEGRTVYEGPREHVLEFFQYMGFKCPERKGVADYLQEVTSRKDQEQYWEKEDKPYNFVSVTEFAEAFQSFHIGRRLADELSVPFDKANSHPAALTTKKYGIGWKELLKALFSREYLLMKRNSFVYIFKLSQLIIMAFIMMTLFLRTKLPKNTPNDGVILMGGLFISLVMILYNAFSELPMTILKLPTFYKQRDLLFFPAWGYSLPAWILKIPMTFLEVGVWVFTSYYVIGLDPNVGRLFKMFLLLVCVNQMASGLFRFMAAIGRILIVANLFGSFAMLAVLVLGGFVLSKEDIKKWWIWGYWVSPLMYGQNALAVNEFLGNSWKRVPPNSTEPLGVLVLKFRGIPTEAHWYWLGVGALIAYVFLFNFLFTLALTYLNPFGKPQALLFEETLDERNPCKTGNIELSSKGKRSSEMGDEMSMSSSGRNISEANQKRKRGMVLPFEPLSITFEDIKYAIDMPQEMKARGVPEDRLELLKGVSGAFRPGVLTALMGVSGAGKTTLMDVLAGRKTSGYIEGRITVSGYPKKQETFARIAGYCEQTDIHSPHVTVYESLQYSAWLRLSPEVDSGMRKMFIDEVMELVELAPLREALVGLPGVNGLSIEQRKRLTIAVELVANPSIIFMDEPTSGLDARAAAIVMRTVRNTVDTGRTVVCTIHQPSIDIFDSFDEGIDGVSKIKDGYNPATWMLEVTSPAQEDALGVNFADVYRNSELYRRNKELITEQSMPPPGSKDLYFATQYSQSFFTQCLACLWKQHLSYWRNPSYTAVRLLFTFVIALMFGTIFWDLGSKRATQSDIFNAMGSMYSAVMFIGVQNAGSVQPVVAIGRTVFYREKAAGMYSSFPYAFGQIVIEIPYVFVQTLLYGVIVYAMIGFDWTVSKFLWYLFFMNFTWLYYTFYGMMAVAITPSQNIAAITSSAFYGMWNLFSGFTMPKTRAPVWWKWYFNICPVYWTLYGLVGSQFGDIQDKFESFDRGQNVEQYVRSYFGFRHDFLGYVAMIVVGFSLLFAVIFAFSIKAFNFQKR
ncbi:hypothetical protein Vadar_026918 [Vaccinium darrowii]|uniref:Uncharacterized protein n=1 Tax=Vaccinium darrowii TaxID=229202 RepID=A0ACB7XK69_9ERIC|nr:hypothetical protein Vadar_026918 [Vaccinium darrowii]